MIIRQATYEDVIPISFLLEEGIRRWHGVPKPDETLLLDVKTVIDQGVAFVAEKAGIIYGAIGLVKDHWFFSKKEFLGDKWFYVRPEARSSRCAFKLMDKAKEVAEALEIPLILAHIYGEDIERKNRFYERQGFRQLGCVYAKGL